MKVPTLNVPTLSKALSLPSLQPATIKYPSRADYCTSVRNPQFAFRKKDPFTQQERDLDASLAAGKPVEKRNFDGSTTVWSASGSFGVVFKYETYTPEQTWALKCFCRSNFEVVDRYKKILRKLEQHPCQDYFVAFSLLEEGIRVLGHCYPVVKMAWVEGDNLKKFLRNNLNQPQRLEQLAAQFLQLCQDFSAADLAHGDLQHGNIFVQQQAEQLQLKLIDYDSLYFGGDRSEDNIKGLADYQHPLRQSLKHRCRELDFFSQLVIYLSILALAQKPELWHRCGVEDREGLLFARADFQNPHQAEIFKALAHLPAPIPMLASQLKAICRLKEFSQIPDLGTVLGLSTAPHKRWVFPTLALPTLSLPTLSLPALPTLALPNLALPNLTLPTFTRPTFTKLTLAHPQQQAEMSPVAPLLPVEEQAATPPTSLDWDPRHLKTILPPSAIVLHPRSRPQQPLRALLQGCQGVLISCQKTVQQTQQTVYSQFQTLTGNVASFKLPRLSIPKLDLAKLDLLKLPRVAKPHSPIETWTTAEIATFLDCSAAWCHQQRYRFTDSFKVKTHYFKDPEGTIHWTKRGLQQLYRLHKAQQNLALPAALLSTKEVSQQLQIATEQLTKLKAKYANLFKPGEHYQLDTRKHYYWTAAGVAMLTQFLQEAPEATTPKPAPAKPKPVKPNPVQPNLIKDSQAQAKTAPSKISQTKALHAKAKRHLPQHPRHA
jgi:hypothetical protein